jgi:peptidoglycan/xylan/chitin deacetylase (PgdA/CDA1 family)
VADLAGLVEVPRDLLLRRYPAFVTGGELPRGHVPVFVFHSLDPAAFGGKLEHLARNGYVTLSTSEYRDVIEGRTPPPQRAVLLTIDDGRASVYSVGYPLLRRHGMKATVFLVPSRVTEASARPLAEDAALDAPEPNEGFLSWAEVERLAGTGLFDFQSHTLNHARVHVAPEIVGFVTPQSRHGYAALDIPRIHEGRTDLEPDQIPLGTPILRFAPRMSDTARFYEEIASREPIVAAVADGGGEAFFERPGWERRLRALVGGIAIRGEYETPAEHEAALARELAESKRLIESHTGRAVEHLCYPWHVSGVTARRLARRIGYRTAFWGKVRGTPVTLPGGDPLAIARIGEDYVETLPGDGRRGLLAVLRMKWSRRFARRP